MIKIKNTLWIILLFIIWFWIVVAANNFLRVWENWDANVDPVNLPNDVFILDWRLDLIDSRTPEYELWHRWKITWSVITSVLFGDFDLDAAWFDLTFRTNDTSTVSSCWVWENPLEIYDISWSIDSSYWWWLVIDEVNSYFCSNQYIHIELLSDSLGSKDIWDDESNLVDNFDKQLIHISWIAKIKWDADNIFNRTDNSILVIESSNNKLISKSNIKRNIVNDTRGIEEEISNPILSNFTNNSTDDKLIYYNYTWDALDTITFKWLDYINEWKILTIWWTLAEKLSITWKNTVIVKWWNIYIEDNLYNTDDSSSLLILIATRDENTWNGWNIYINPLVTNIDAVLIADWTLISMNKDHLKIYDVNTDFNDLRKQLLIYWSVYTSNNVWDDTMPFWADYYESSLYVSNTMSWSIYDLWNLRTFNLNYWDSWLNCIEESKIAPIDWNWNFLLNAWAWWKECYNDDSTLPDLRWSDKTNPLIIEYNPNIGLLKPAILRDY